jgi:sec-independent protein translocase protein TatA
MGSLGTGEILVIVLVALIVFGPHRLPEITRKAGEWLAKAREMSRSFTDTLDAEYGEIAAPIKDLKGEYDATMNQVKGMAASIPDLSADLPTIELKPGGDVKKSPDDDAVVSDDAESSPLDEEAS